MATLQDLLDDLNDRLNDANNAAGAGEANKIRWINRGISAMWPRVFRTVVDSTLVVATDTFEYSIPAAVGDEGEIFRVEIEDQSAPSTRFVELDGFDVVPLVDGRTLQLPSWLASGSTVGAQVRISAAKPLSQLVDTTDVFDGRAIHEELPVWYALGLALSRRIEDRTVHTRLSTIDSRNGVDINEQMGAAGFAFAQFEAMLDRLAMPWPASVG